MSDILLDITYASMSYFDLGNQPAKRVPENFFHGLVLGLIVSLKDRYRIVSNRESGRGRYDIALYPKQEDLDAFIMEFKVCDERTEKVWNRRQRMHLSRSKRKTTKPTSSPPAFRQRRSVSLASHFRVRKYSS